MRVIALLLLLSGCNLAGVGAERAGELTGQALEVVDYCKLSETARLELRNHFNTGMQRYYPGRTEFTCI